MAHGLAALLDLPDLQAPLDRLALHQLFPALPDQQAPQVAPGQQALPALQDLQADPEAPDLLDLLDPREAPEDPARLVLLDQLDPQDLLAAQVDKFCLTVAVCLLVTVT